MKFNERKIKQFLTVHLFSCNLNWFRSLHIGKVGCDKSKLDDGVKKYKDTYNILIMYTFFFFFYLPI